jgi:hypothetical protein
LLAQPEGVIPHEVASGELFSLLSNFYLNPTPGQVDTAATSDFILV